MPIAAVELELELVTPCFLGGADRRKRAEWRAASIRGQLRWWFRAVAGARFQGNLKEVSQAEESLFGSTSRASVLRVRALDRPAAKAAGDNSPHGKALGGRDLALLWGENPPSTSTEGRLELRSGRGNPIEYLGYGAILRERGRGSVFEHGRFEAGQPASFELLWRRGLSAREGEILRDALWCWLNLGGIGARSRRGFGSLRCLRVEGRQLGELENFASLDRDAFRKRAREILPPYEELGAAGSLPAWSHLSSQTRVYLGQHNERNWQDAMVRAGAWLIAFRRRYGSANHEHPALRPREARDYEWAAPQGRRHQDEKIPDRAGFGLPLPFGERGETVTWGKADRDGRRASPLLLHIACFGEQEKAEFLPVLTYIPAALVPPDERLFLKGRPDSGAFPEKVHTGIVERFLDDLSAKGLIEEVRR